MIPGELRYTAEHEWVRANEDGTLTFGITHHAQDALGDIVYVSVPTVGSQVAAGSPCGEVESTKSVSDIYAPVSGAVVEVNTALSDQPETINADPYGAGWLVRLKPDASDAFNGLLGPTEYEALTRT
ncbi:MAG: glycine cleavage system protein GcvH [Actinomycetales bacterium]|nr:glycine cleavage system protein GcvH [Actinomycetales bacterium]